LTDAATTTVAAVGDHVPERVAPMPSSIGLREPKTLSPQRLLQELRGRERSNAEVLQSLGWSTHEFWQTRTELVDERSIVAKSGDAGVLSIPLESPVVAVDPNVGAVLHHLITESGKTAAVGAVKIGTLAKMLGASEEQVVVACSRLLRMKFIEPRADAIELTDRLFVTEDPDANLVTLLNAFPTNDWGTVPELSNAVNWDPQKVDTVLTQCAEHKLVERKGPTIVERLPASKAFLQHRSSNGGATLCDSPEAFTDLHQAVRAGKVTAFVGAGASIGAGLPNWKGLLAPLIGRVERREEKDELIGLDPTHAAAALMLSLGETEFNREIQKALEVKKYPASAVHVALNLLKPHLSGVVTTNLDGLLEENLGWDSANNLAKAIQDPKGKVIHLHGVIDDPSSWVLTRKQYNEKFYKDAPYSQAVHSLFIQSTLMFVGYAMKDFELDRVLDLFEGAYPHAERPRHYFFMPADEARASPYFRKRLSKLGMREILVRNVKDDLPILLARLAFSTKNSSSQK
jgi:hypothetical protein